MSTPPSILRLDYSSLGETPSERMRVLQSAVRLVKKPIGLYGRRNLHLTAEAWQSLLTWIDTNKPDGLRREQSQIRILKRFDGHAIIGTAALIDDLKHEHADGSGRDISAAPDLDDVWRAARRVYASK